MGKVERVVHMFSVCDSALQWEWNQSSLQAVWSSKKYADTNCSFYVYPIWEIVTGCQGKIGLMKWSEGFLLEERPFWIPVLVVSAQKLCSSSPTSLLWLTTLFKGLRIIILGLLPTVIRTTVLKLSLSTLTFIYVSFVYGSFPYITASRNYLLQIITFWSIMGAWAKGKLVLSRRWQELVARPLFYTKLPVCVRSSGMINTDRLIPLRNHSSTGLRVQKANATKNSGKS